MKLSSFIGLVGGKPRFAYYFVGHLESPAGPSSNDEDEDNPYNKPFRRESSSEEAKQDDTDRLVFLDPHCVNPQVDFTR